MGKVFQTVFGGDRSKSKSTQESYNKSYDYIKDTYGGMAQGSQKATGALEALLGISGDTEAANQAFSNYRDSAGYDFIRDEGMRGITGSAAARGLLQSGSTAKALSRYGSDVASTFYNNYLDRLLGLSGQGLQAGALISDAGKVSYGQSTSSASKKPGLIGPLFSAGAAGGGG